MSFLRRRLLRDSSTEASRDPLPVGGEHVTLVPTSELKSLKAERSKRRNGFIFGLGGLFGIFLAAFFATRHDVISFEGLMDLNLESLMDVIPAGIVKDAKDITVRSSPALIQPVARRLKLIQPVEFSEVRGKQSTTIHSL